MGERLRFQASLEIPEDWSFGEAYSCQFGSILNCSGWEAAGDASYFEISATLSAWDAGYYIYAEPQVGSIISLVDLDHERLALYNDQFYAYVHDEYAEFRVVADNLAPAPIPLPASALLLPIGLGTLSLMRRRRRQSA